MTQDVEMKEPQAPLNSVSTTTPSILQQYKCIETQDLQSTKVCETLELQSTKVRETLASPIKFLQDDPRRRDERAPSSFKFRFHHHSFNFAAFEGDCLAY